MRLYFENSKNRLSDLGEVKTEEEAMEKITAFCEERRYRIPYVRTWLREIESLGKGPCKVFDVGSHTEFFYLTEEESHDKSGGL